LSGFIALAVACADPPEKEMHQAQGAIDAARAAGAPTYAAEEFEAAVAALERSQAAVTERDYRQALSLALDARERAQEAARAAAENRARLRSEVDAQVAAADAALAALTRALEAARAAKVPAAQVASATAAAGNAGKAIASGRQASEAGDYPRARAALDGLVPQLERAKAEVDTATQARSTRRPVRRGGR
jgi:hypothetical protein